MIGWKKYAIVLTVLSASHLYLWGRVEALLDFDISLLSTLATIALLTCGCAALLQTLRRPAPLIYRRAMWFVSLWFGFVVYALPIFGLGHLVGYLLHLGALNGYWSVGEPTVKALTLGLPALLSLGIVAWGLIEAKRTPKVRDLEVQIQDLPAKAEGLMAVQISDIHLSRLLSTSSLRSLVDQVNGLEPDLLLLTGDIIDAVDEVFPDLEAFLKELQRFKPRLESFAITGNHEFYSRGREAIAHLERVGFRVLKNEVVEPIPGLLLAGIHDHMSQFNRYPELRTPPSEFESILGPSARDFPTILLYHQPLYAERFAELGVDLMLSGHTHAGQLLPFGRWSKGAYTYFQGLYRIGEMSLYVSPGVGSSGPPMRIGARREITRVILRRSKKGAATA